MRQRLFRGRCLNLEYLDASITSFNELRPQIEAALNPPEIDERSRKSNNGTSDYSFTLVYHLLSFDRNEDIRLKVGLKDEFPSHPSITALWPMANWYEREIYDMFGITFTGHPHLTRLLMPQNWKGHHEPGTLSCRLRRRLSSSSTGAGEHGPDALGEDAKVHYR